MVSILQLEEIAEYTYDMQESLRAYFSRSNPQYKALFIALRPSEVASLLNARISETELQSSLAVLARVEAALRTDYAKRCKQKSPDNVSIAFRKIHKKRGKKVRLEDDILRTWRKNIQPADQKFINSLSQMLKFRHWLAHGRYWQFGDRHDYQDVYVLADAVLSTLPLKN